MTTVPSDLALLAYDLLKTLIRTPSLSGEEGPTADHLAQTLVQHGVRPERFRHNVWAVNQYFDPRKPTLLLNSHHDTVRPNRGYTRDPFEAYEADGRLYGLGSNDAGGALVCLLGAFLHFYQQPGLPCNLLYAATAEEETSGPNGIAALLPLLPDIACAIVGEPTQMQAAVAEKGLMVLECVARGRSGHAAREEGDNAIYRAMEDIAWFRTFCFPEESPTLGPVKMTTTIIRAGSQHNVVPDTCEFTVDVRTTDRYSNEDALAIIKQHISSEIKPRSLRLNPSGLSPDHPLARAAAALGLPTYGSPTLSDQAFLKCPSVKMGPGDSARSHTADEYIYQREVEAGVSGYTRYIEAFMHELSPGRP